MRIVSESVEHGVRVRLAACECREGCDTHYAFAQKAEQCVSREQLWMCLGYGGMGEIREQVAWLFDDVPGADESLVRAVDRAVACFGLPWADLSKDDGAPALQMTAWSAEDGEMDGLEPEFIWKAREHALGHPLTRVSKALGLLADSYTREGPAVRRG